MSTSMPSLLDAVTCPCCATLEWTREDLTAVHGRTTGPYCAHQEHLLDDLNNAIINHNHDQARRAYQACENTHTPHLIQFMFACCHLYDMPMPLVVGEGVHHFAGILRPDGTYGSFDQSTQRGIYVCACGAHFPGPKPAPSTNDWVHDLHPNLNDHLTAHENAR